MFEEYSGTVLLPPAEDALSYRNDWLHRILQSIQMQRWFYCTKKLRPISPLLWNYQKLTEFGQGEQNLAHCTVVAAEAD